MLKQIEVYAKGDPAQKIVQLWINTACIAALDSGQAPSTIEGVTKPVSLLFMTGLPQPYVSPCTVEELVAIINETTAVLQ